MDSEKLKGKGVDSVRSRVVNLKEYCPDITADLVARSLTMAFSEIDGLPATELDGSFFTNEAREAIQKDMEYFSSPEWLYGRNLPFTHRLAGRYPWGGIEILLKGNRGMIEDCVCHTDAMDTEFAERLSGCFQGRRYEKKELQEALENAGLSGKLKGHMIFGIIELLEREL